jgi:hypothetical protein
MRRRLMTLTVSAMLCVLMLALAPTARAVTVDPMLFISFKGFTFKPAKKKKPGMLIMNRGRVTAVRYRDGSTTTTKTSFETIVGAKVIFSPLFQTTSDPYTFLDGTVTIKAGKKLFIKGNLTDITFDPGTDTTDGIVTLNLGFQLDNYWFTFLNTGAGSRFITEYHDFSSPNAGSLALTLVSQTEPNKLIDGFNVKVNGSASGVFQIPEPGTLILLAAGLAGLFRAARSR